MSSLKIYEYYNSNSVIHKINPIVKIIWLAVFSVLILASNNLYYIIALLILTIAAQTLTKIPLMALKQYIAYLFFFLILSFVLIVVTRENFIVGILFLLKVSILIISAVQFTLTTTQKELLVSLIKTRVPYSFAFTLTIALRFLPTIVKEAKEVMDAQRTRAHKLIFNIFKPATSVRSYIPVVIPLFIIIFNRSFELSLAAETRGFTPKIYEKQKLKFRFIDFCVLLILFFLLFLFFRFEI